MLLGFPLGYGWVWTLPYERVQGVAFKILYVHVPSAWLSLGLYGMLALSSLIYLVNRSIVFSALAGACAWMGGGFTLLCLFTGMLWGQVTWGTWWVWDARLTAVALLFFLYVGYIVLRYAFPQQTQGLHNASLLTLFGSINLPIIKWSVTWWHTLHQPASIMKWGAPSMATSFLWPLLFCTLGWVGYGIMCVLWLTWSSLNRQSHRIKGKA